MHGLDRREVALLAAAVVVGTAACKRSEESEPAARREPGPPAGSSTRAVSAGPPDAGAITAPPALPEAPPLPPSPRGLPPLASPEHNPTTPEKVELGRVLFFDPRLSATGKTSCASCHQPQRGWADGIARARTDAGQPNLRHTPSLYNVGYHREWGWDGVMPTIEALILSHWKGQLGRRPEDAVALLRRAPEYAARFTRAFAAPAEHRPAQSAGAVEHQASSAGAVERPAPSAGPAQHRPAQGAVGLERDHVAEALAAFLRTVTSGDSAVDRHETGPARALPLDAEAGRKIFSKRAGCATCHPPPLYTDLEFHDRGIAMADRGRDPGRMRVTADARQLGAFKTPGLRSLIHSAPYFHDGSAATLEAAMNSELARDRIILSTLERAQLLAFLRALSAPPETVARPALPALP